MCSLSFIYDIQPLLLVRPVAMMNRKAGKASPDAIRRADANLGNLGCHTGSVATNQTK
jgi:hypothetical protein